MNASTLQPYRIQIADEVLADLKTRLARVRWPDEIPDSGWRFGANLAYLKALVDYWRDGYDWRAREAKLNQLEQYTAPVAGIDVRFIHARGVGPNPMPLLLSHGWPGSIVEFQRIIPMLADPARFGGDANEAFSVVAPSLPGFGFSFRPDQPRFGAADIAPVFAELMTDVLGYKKFAAQGGDWGAFVSSALAMKYPERLHGVHLNLLAVRRDAALAADASEEERKFFADLQHWLREETGYQAIMGTKPQTLAFALSDSPVGLAAWIIEKFYSWSDCNGDLDGYFGKDLLLDNIMCYWATGAIGSTFWPYYARLHATWPLQAGQGVRVPTAYAEFPKEMLHPPRVVAERYYNIQQWTQMPRGGHFAALEEPALLAEDVRKFFRQFR